jgi:hypothetical protein
MKEYSSLPPLSVRALRDLTEIEEEVADAVKDCNNFSLPISKIFQNPKRTERLLQTYLVAALDVQFDYYSTLPNYRASWIVQIIGNTVSSFIGLFPPFASGEQHRSVLLQTAAEYVKTRQWKLPKQTGELQSRNGHRPISEQIEALRKECQVTLDKLAEEIDVDVRTVRRHLRGQSIPYDRHLWAYEKVFSKLQNRKAIINKMS